MNTKRTRVVLLLSLVFSVMTCLEGKSEAQEATLTPGAQAALDYYLDVDCTVGDEQTDKRDLKKLLSGIPQKTFFGLIAQGTSQKDSLRRIEAALEREWSRRQAFLAGKALRNWKEEDLKLLKGLTKERFIQLRRDAAIRRHRNRALFAYVTFASAKDIQDLKALRAEAPLPLKESIDQVLVRFRPESR